MRLWINGQAQELELPTSNVRQLLLLLGHDLERPNFVVALNQELLAAADYANTMLKADDQLDILGVITGG